MKLCHLSTAAKTILPFSFSGGILVTIAFLLDNYTLNPAAFGSNLPQAAFFIGIGRVVGLFVMPVLCASIAEAIAGRRAVAVGLFAGYLAGGSAGFLGAMLVGFLAGHITLLLNKLFTLIQAEGVWFLSTALAVLILGIVIEIGINPTAQALSAMAFNTLGQIKNTVVLGAVLGAMMGVDINGPLSQGAYMFATASLSGGNEMVMSAVMSAGMAYTLSAAIFAVAFPKISDKNLRIYNYSNFVFSLSFLPDGAIPLAAVNPLKTLPAFLIGAASAGALSMTFNCSISVPYGGLIVYSAINNKMEFFGCVLLGALLSTAMLALMHKINWNKLPTHFGG